MAMPDERKWSVVFLDASTLDIGDVSFERFGRWDCGFHPRTAPEELPGRVEGRDVAVTNKVVFDKEVLGRPEAAGLKLIAIAATGTNNVDLGAAGERGLPVCNVAGYSTGAVVQQTLGCIIELASCVGRYAGDVRAGEWESSPVFTLLTRRCVELQGKTLGIVGYGQIGRGVAAAARGFGMEVLIAARPGADGPLARPLPEGRVALDEMLRRADVVTLHCPLTPETEGLIGGREIGLMKPTAFLINAARGGVVDEAALIGALREKRIAGAAADVLTEEPPPRGHPMVEAARELDNLIVTPHTAWAALEARQRLVDEIAGNIAAFERGEERNRVA